MDKISCTKVSEMLSAYLDGELNHIDKSFAFKHLEECVACRTFYLQLKLQRETLHHISKRIPKERPAISEKVMNRLPKYDMGVFTDPIVRRFALVVCSVVILISAGVYIEKITVPASTSGLYATQIDGDAQVFQAKNWGSLQPNSKISVPAFFRTRPGADMALRIDDSRFFLKEGGFLQVLRFSPEMELNLEKGTLLVVARPRAATRKVIINTMEAQIEVTGTIFKVRADDNSTKVEVLEGSVRIKDPVTGKKFTTVKEFSRATVFSKTQHIFINDELSDSEIEILKADFFGSGLLEKDKEQGAREGSVIFWREIK